MHHMRIVLLIGLLQSIIRVSGILIFILFYGDEKRDFFFLLMFFFFFFCSIGFLESDIFPTKRLGGKGKLKDCMIPNQAEKIISEMFGEFHAPDCSSKSSKSS